MKTKLQFISAVLLGAFVSSCGSRHEGGSESPSSETTGASHEEHLPPQYAFIETNLGTITLQDVIDKLGPYTKVGRLSPDNTEELVYEFDFPDHSALLVSLQRRFEARNRVYRTRFYPVTNDLHLFPEVTGITNPIGNQ